MVQKGTAVARSIMFSGCPYAKIALIDLHDYFTKVGRQGHCDLVRFILVNAIPGCFEGIYLTQIKYISSTSSCDAAIRVIT